MDDQGLLAALFYQAHHARHPEDLPFWLDLAAQEGDPILELGCGTGRVLIPLAQSGHQVYGLDRDARMLAVLHRNLPEELVARAHIFQSDLASFCLARRFPLILLPCNTWSTLIGKSRQAACACVARHLAPGGLFALSLPNPSALSRLPAQASSEFEEHFPHPVTGGPVQVSSEWERTGQGFILRWHYDHLLPDGRVQRLTLQSRHDLAPFELYRDELCAAGLSIQVTFGDYDRTAYGPDSPHLLILARKNG